MKEKFEFMENSLEKAFGNVDIDVAGFVYEAQSGNDGIAVDIDVDGKHCEFNLSFVATLDMSDIYMFGIKFGNNCTDVKMVNKLMNVYDKSPMASIIELTGLVENENDSLTLSTLVTVNNSEDLVNGIEKVLRALLDENISHDFWEITEYFE